MINVSFFSGYYPHPVPFLFLIKNGINRNNPKTAFSVENISGENTFFLFKNLRKMKEFFMKFLKRGLGQRSAASERLFRFHYEKKNPKNSFFLFDSSIAVYHLTPDHRIS